MTDDQFRVEHHERISRLENLVEHHERISRLENRVDNIDQTLSDVRSDVRALHADLQANTATTQRVATDTADLVTITRSVYGLARFILWLGAAAGAGAAVWHVFKGT